MINDDNGPSEPTDSSASMSRPLQKEVPSPHGQFLMGKYCRLLILIISLPLLAWFTYTFSNYRTGTVPLIATAILLGSLAIPGGYRELRIVLLVAMSINLLVLVFTPNEIRFSNRVAPHSKVPSFVLLSCLIAASFFEIQNWVKSCSRNTLTKLFAWSLLAIPALAYILGIPFLTMVWDFFEADEKKLALKDPDWNLWNEATFRAAKFGVFAAFTYVGACLGSFLNVVAYCVPKGEAIGLRDSKCPKCFTKLSRLDNLPIFSYINLGARCRSCSTVIPIRYLIVELVVATIFGSLFLYQLVTGCVNIPKMNFTHSGILWIIMYPKWPAIGLYFYHVLFMSMIVVLSLIEWDKQPLRLTFSIILVVGFFAASVIYLPLHSESLTGNLPLSVNLPLWLEQILKPATGGALGALIGFGLGSVLWDAKSPIATLAFSLAGIVLGWQALVQVVIIFALISIAMRVLTKSIEWRQSRPTTILLIVIMVHHPFWSMISNLWDFS